MAYVKQNWTDGESSVNAERMSHIEDGIAVADANMIKSGAARAIFANPGTLDYGTTKDIKFSGFVHNNSGGMITLGADGCVNFNARVKSVIIAISIRGNEPFNLYPTVNGWDPIGHNIQDKSLVNNSLYVTIAAANTLNYAGIFELKLYPIQSGLNLEVDEYWQYVDFTVLYY